MKAPISNPLNPVQKHFNQICEEGGGPGGGPTRDKVVNLLHYAGTTTNGAEYGEIAKHMTEFEDRNPWHVCFVLGLPWGHFAKWDLDFTDAATRCLANWNDTDLKTAKSLYGYKGPDVIEYALRGGYMMFETVRLPEELPADLDALAKVQQRWFGRVLAPDRPAYIGAWNATAMFMMAIFAQPSLAEKLTDRTVLLPPSGAVNVGLSRLHHAKFINEGPDGSSLDDAAFEPGVLYKNNELFERVRRGRDDWSLLDVHSGLYILGTGLTDVGQDLSI